MQTDVVLVPQLLEPRRVANGAVVVLDVLRATTTMVAAFGAGAREVCVYGSIDEARGARSSANDVLLCGEANCRRPDGFDLGNSPSEFTRDRVAGKSIRMSTTNGTRAILAGRGAARLFAAALVNSTVTARHLADLQMDVTLLCAGTGGAIALEDIIGAGAILAALNRLTANKPASDSARIALELFAASENSLPQTLRSTLGGRNVIAAGLEGDIDFAARLDVFNHVLTIDPSTLIVTRTVGV